MSIHQGHRERMKTEFLARGLDGWHDHKVLELVLFYAIPQGDVNPVAHALLDKFGSLAGVLDAPVEELMRVKGIGKHAALLLHLLVAVSGAYTASRNRRAEIIHTPEDAYSVLHPYFFGAKNELVYILCLDGKNQFLGVRQIAQGSIWAAEINLRRIMEEVVSLRAAKIYLAHNHVGSLALPSRADWDMTVTAYGVLENVGIELCDHLIFQDEEMVSLRQSRRGRILLPEDRPF